MKRTDESVGENNEQTKRLEKGDPGQPTETEQWFEKWMSLMSDALAEFVRLLPAKVRDDLDYSVDSLDVIEAWLLDRYEDFEATRAETDPIVFDGAARYIGETYRRTIGGEWWVDPEGRVLDGLPHVVKFRSCSSGWICPLIEATAAIDRRTGSKISNVWRRQVAWISGKAERNPLLDDKQFRRHIEETDEEREYRYWLDRMDSELEHLFAALPGSMQEDLDYSEKSLDALEVWLVTRYPSAEAARAESQVLMLDGVARYVGETFRNELGGEWWFDLEGWSHNGLPQVVGFADAAQAGPVCPLALAHEAVERRGGVLRDALRARRPSGSARN